jgi:hypothetical protein
MSIGVNGWRFPDYSDTPDVPRDLGNLGDDIAAFIEAHPGPQGDPGPSNTLSIGTVTTVTSETGASATITGTSPTQTLNLQIPRGIDGIIGGPGPSNVLTVGTVTTGAAGVDAEVSITGTSPEQVINFVIPRGATGLTGAQGDKGDKGDAAATITVNSTTTGAAGTNASVTNTGTSSDVILNFVIPRGADGATGATGATGADGAPGADGLNANLEPIDNKIQLNPPTVTGSFGVNGNWYPAYNNLNYLGQLADSGQIPAWQARVWKSAYLQISPTITSDIRAKENISDSTLGLDFINDLRPVRYHYGLIAQEVKEAIDASGVEDFGGWVKEDLNDPESSEHLRYEELVAPLIKAVQELTARIQALEAK